jgi:hypothetical protein
MGSHTINGDEWYSFTPLRDGTISVEATTSAGEVTARLYDANYHLMVSSSATSFAEISLGSTVTAGATYMLRLWGENATAEIAITNQVPQADRLDTSRDGLVGNLDALRIINELLVGGLQSTPFDASNAKMYLDTNLDGQISAGDALQVINYLLTVTASPLASPAATAGPSGATTALPLAEPSRGETLESPTADVSVAFALSLGSGAPAVVPAVDAVFAQLALVSEEPHAEPLDEPLLLIPEVESELAEPADDNPLARETAWDWLA